MLLNVVLLGMTNQPVCSVIYSQYNPASHTPSLLPACPQESSTAGKPWCSWRVLCLWDGIVLALAVVTVLLSSGCCNKMPQTTWPIQQTFITHSSGGWRSKGLADSVSTQSLFPCVWVCVCMSPLAKMQTIWSTKTLLLSWKYLLCWLCLGFRTQKVLPPDRAAFCFFIYYFHISSS